ncbi:histidine phosphatase family protein [Bacillus paramycoides]
MTVICLVRHGETDWNSEGRLQGREDIPYLIRLNFVNEKSVQAVSEGTFFRFIDC